MFSSELIKNTGAHKHQLPSSPYWTINAHLILFRTNSNKREHRPKNSDISCHNQQITSFISQFFAMFICASRLIFTQNSLALSFGRSLSLSHSLYLNSKHCVFFSSAIGGKWNTHRNKISSRIPSLQWCCFDDFSLISLFYHVESWWL